VSTHEVIALSVALPIISIIIVALRFLTRRMQNVKLGIDDWLIVNGLVFLVAMAICMLIGTRNGAMGSPTPPPPANLTPEEQEFYTDPSTTFTEKLEFPFQIFMMIAYASIKISLLAFYRRIFVVSKNNAFDIIVKVSATVVFLWTLAFIFIIIFDCGTAIWANWGAVTAQLQFCAIGFTSEYGLAISDFLVDVFIFVLPLPVIWRLQLSMQKKIAVSGIFLLGGAAIGASIARMVLYIQILSGVTKDEAIDPNLELTVGLWWSLLEVGLSLIAACLPTLSFLFKRMSLESALRSVRSVFSIHSSQHSSKVTTRNDTGHNPYIDIESSRLKKSATATSLEDRASHGGSGDEYGMQDM